MGAENRDTELYGDELRQLIASRGISQKELAISSGVDQPSISLACTGTRALSAENQRKLARALDLDHQDEDYRARPDQNASAGSREDADPAVRFVAGQRQKVDYPAGGAVGTLHEAGDLEGANAPLGEGRILEVHGLRNWRASKQLSQSELARRAGLNAHTIGQIERKGQTSRKSARMLASALNVSLQELAAPEQRGRFAEKDSPGAASVSATASGTALAEAERQSLSSGAHEAAQAPLQKDGREAGEPGSVPVPGLRYCRKHRGLSQKTLADSAGMPANSVGRIEKRGRAATTSAKALARALDVSLGDLADPDPRKRLTRRSQPEAGSRSDAGSRSARSDGATIACKGERVSADAPASGSSSESFRGPEPLRIEVSEPTLERVDRVLDILEALFTRRSRQ